MKLSTSKKKSKQVDQYKKISTSDLEIKVKEKYCNISDVKGISLFLHVFYVYMQTFVFLAYSGNELQF